MSSSAPDAAQACRVFLRLTPGVNGATLAAQLADPLVASVLLPSGIAADAAGRALVKSIQSTDRPALVADNADLRAALEADGVHLSAAGPIAALRRKLGDGVIIGAECPAERHACMVAAEDGADYVAVRVTGDNRDPVIDLLGWWQEIMTVPIVAFIDAPMDTAEIKARADFIAPLL